MLETNETNIYILIFTRDINTVRNGALGAMYSNLPR